MKECDGEVLAQETEIEIERCDRGGSDLRCSLPLQSITITVCVRVKRLERECEILFVNGREIEERRQYSETKR